MHHSLSLQQIRHVWSCKERIAQTPMWNLEDLCYDRIILISRFHTYVNPTHGQTTTDTSGQPQATHACLCQAYTCITYDYAEIYLHTNLHGILNHTWMSTHVIPCCMPGTTYAAVRVDALPQKHARGTRMRQNPHLSFDTGINLQPNIRIISDNEYAHTHTNTQTHDKYVWHSMHIRT